LIVVNGIQVITLRSITAAALVAVAACVFIASARPTQATPPAGYTLVWDDEFNGTVGSSPSSSNWNFQTGAGGWGNNELETYTNSTTNASIETDSAAPNGKALFITATNSGGNYDSARINTQSKHYWTYGYMEASINHPSGTGLWPAWWMMGEDAEQSGDTVSNWPECGEIDIFEQFEANPTNEFSDFYYGTTSDLENWSGSISVAASGYNTYALLWTSTTTEEYYNGTGYDSHSNPGSPFNAAFFFLINMAVGGNPGNPTSSTPFPSTLKIGYVRAYQPSSTTTSSTSSTTSTTSTSSTTGGSGVANGTYQLDPECATGSRLDDASASTANGNKIDIYASNGTAAQKWAFSTTSVSPAGDYNASTIGAYCLQASGTASGSATELWACNGASTQSWSITTDSSPAGYYQLHPASSSSLCLDVSGASSANGTVVEIYTCNSTNAQQWGGL
jgi:beta-glucanase (GH16 family)